MGKSWEIVDVAAVSWPDVSLHCPRIHTYSHTQQFSKINCVIPTRPSSESDRRWLDSDLYETVTHVRNEAILASPTRRHWYERRGSRRHGLLGRREDVACGRRARYVLRTLDSEVHPSCIHGLKHFFGRSGVALRDAELLERFCPACTRDCKGFHVRFRTSPNCSATSSAVTIEPSSTARCPDSRLARSKGLRPPRRCR